MWHKLIGSHWHFINFVRFWVTNEDKTVHLPNAKNKAVRNLLAQLALVFTHRSPSVQLLPTHEATSNTNAYVAFLHPTWEERSSFSFAYACVYIYQWWANSGSIDPDSIDCVVWFWKYQQYHHFGNGQYWPISKQPMSAHPLFGHLILPRY